MAQILINSRMCATGHRPICQDTGIVTVFAKVGMDVRWDGATMSLDDMINEGVRRAYQLPENVLRASILADPAGKRTNTTDNTPAVIHYQVVPGNTIELHVAATGGCAGQGIPDGSDRYPRAAPARPAESGRGTASGDHGQGQRTGYRRPGPGGADHGAGHQDQGLPDPRCQSAGVHDPQLRRYPSRPLRAGWQWPGRTDSAAHGCLPGYYLGSG